MLHFAWQKSWQTRNAASFLENNLCSGFLLFSFRSPCILFLLFFFTLILPRFLSIPLLFILYPFLLKCQNENQVSRKPFPFSFLFLSSFCLLATWHWRWESKKRNRKAKNIWPIAQVLIHTQQKPSPGYVKNRWKLVGREYQQHGRDSGLLAAQIQAALVLPLVTFKRWVGFPTSARWDLMRSSYVGLMVNDGHIFYLDFLELDMASKTDWTKLWSVPSDAHRLINRINVAVNLTQGFQD